eukprot:scaffold662565_cov51-Prasinocladus_malaysianus.AAC.1
MKAQPAARLMMRVLLKLDGSEIAMLPDSRTVQSLARLQALMLTRYRLPRVRSTAWEARQIPAVQLMPSLEKCLRYGIAASCVTKIVKKNEN